MESIEMFQKRSGANALPLESFQFSYFLLQKRLALAHHLACNDDQNQPAFAVDFFLPYHERYLEWRQAEDVQLHVCAEKQVVVIEKGVLEVCASREAYLRCDRQMDQFHYSWQVCRPKGLPIKPHLSLM